MRKRRVREKRVCKEIKGETERKKLKEWKKQIDGGKSEITANQANGGEVDWLWLISAYTRQVSDSWMHVLSTETPPTHTHSSLKHTLMHTFTHSQNEAVSVLIIFPHLHATIEALHSGKKGKLSVHVSVCVCVCMVSHLRVLAAGKKQNTVIYLWLPKQISSWSGSSCTMCILMCVCVCVRVCVFVWVCVREKGIVSERRTHRHCTQRNCGQNGCMQGSRWGRTVTSLKSRSGLTEALIQTW